MTNLTYDTDACATTATLGYDLVHIKDGKAHRLGTYSSSKKAYANAAAYRDIAGTVEVINRGV